MTDGTNDINQTPTTINNPPDASRGVENPPPKGDKPNEHVPPVEAPGREDVPEHVPEKAGLATVKTGHHH